MTAELVLVSNLELESRAHNALDLAIAAWLGSLALSAFRG